MKRYTFPLLLAAFSLAVMSCTEEMPTGADLAIDQGVNSKHKPGHGGGGPGGEDPTPAGVVYAQLVGGDQVAMDADGNVIETLHADVWGHPSHAVYLVGTDSVRWFVSSDAVPGVYPDSTARSALNAVSETGHKVTLLDDPLLDPNEDARWAPNPTDGKIAFSGRRFTSATAAADEGGIFVVDVSFAAGMPMPVASSLTLLIHGTMIEDTSQCTSTGICYAYSNVFGPGWSPDSTKLLYSKHEGPPDPFETTAIYLYQGGTETLVTSPGAAPRWSQSAGQDVVLFLNQTLLKKGFTSRLWTVNLDGSGLTQMEEISDRIKGANGANYSFARFNGHEWSPDGAHFAYVIHECQIWGAWCNNRLVRRKTDGSGETIIPDIYRLHGWR